MERETKYKLSLKDFITFQKGRTVSAEVDSCETPDGIGWGVEFGDGAKAIFVSQWGADEEFLPSMMGVCPQVAQKPVVWVFDKPLYKENCPGCTFLGTYHHFNKISCIYSFVDLYMCDHTHPDREHFNENTCPTFLARLGNGHGNYYYGTYFKRAEEDEILAEAISRATSRGLFKKEDYPELMPKKSKLGTGLQYNFGGTGGNVVFINPPQYQVQPVPIIQVGEPAYAEGQLVEDDYDDEDEDEDEDINY